MKKSTWNNQVIYSIPIEQVYQFARNNIQDIRYVYDLAQRMGYSRSYFYTRISREFNIKPIELLREVRFKCIRDEILAHPNETSRAIAQRVGLKDEQALYKFLATYRDTNFTLLREQLLFKTD